MCLHCKMVLTDWRQGHTHGCHVHDDMAVAAKQPGKNRLCKIPKRMKEKKEKKKEFLQNYSVTTLKTQQPLFWAAQPFISANFEFQNLCLVKKVLQESGGLNYPRVWSTQGFELRGSWASHCSWQLGEKVDKYDWKQFLDCFCKTQCEHRGFGTLLVLWRYLLFLLGNLLFVRTGARTDDPLLLTPGPHSKSGR